MPEPKVGAECGSPARSDLCGGRPKHLVEGRPYRDPKSTGGDRGVRGADAVENIR
jgi:hypothetical protein